MELENEQKKIEDLPEKKRNSAAMKKRLKEIGDEMVPLKQFLADAKAQRAAIRKEIGVMSLAHLSLLCAMFTFRFFES